MHAPVRHHWNDHDSWCVKHAAKFCHKLGHNVICGRGFFLVFVGISPSLFKFWWYYLVFIENTGILSKFFSVTSPLALPDMYEGFALELPGLILLAHAGSPLFFAIKRLFWDQFPQNKITKNIFLKNWGNSWIWPGEGIWPSVFENFP
jgi:hypothetical protein